MEASGLKNGTFTKAQIESVSRVFQNYLNFNGNKLALLMALAEMESDFGRANVFKFEYEYSRNSLAFKRSKVLQNGYELWGDLCAGSYGPWQILWVSAAENGYPIDTNPQELADPNVSLPYVIKVLNKDIASGGVSVEGLALCYNGGIGALKMANAQEMKYSKRLRMFYDSLALIYK